MEPEDVFKPLLRHNSCKWHATTGKLEMETYYSNGDVNGTWRPGRKLADDGVSVLTYFTF
jgi:hypothetical protein